MGKSRTRYPGENGEWQVAGVKDEAKDDPPWG